MAEQEYDDSLLGTSESMGGVDWDNLEFGDIPSEGKCLCTIAKVLGKQKNFKEYTGPVANIQLKVKDSLVPSDIGKMLFDTINLPHEKEKQGNQNRRALIASRMGLIPEKTKEVVNINWKLLEGKDAVITVIHRKGEGEKANRTYANVEFGGWESPEAWATYKNAGAPSTTSGASSQPAQYGDI